MCVRVCVCVCVCHGSLFLCLRSDGLPHKVTVALTSCSAAFHYLCAPEQSPSAFLIAAVTNTSPYTFLPSTNVQVFVGTLAARSGVCECVVAIPSFPPCGADGNFVCVSNIDHVSPNESFTRYVVLCHGVCVCVTRRASPLVCSCLGPDPAVKVDYRDLGGVDTTTGFLSKSSVTQYKFNISIKNTKPAPITVLLAEAVCP